MVFGFPTRIIQSMSAGRSSLIGMAMPWHPTHSLRLVKITRCGKPTTTSWKSVTGDEDPRERERVGYFETLEDAAVVTWRNWSQRHLPIEERQGV